MELIAMGQMLWRRWWLVLLPALVALVLTLPSLGDVVSPPVTYQVQMRLTAAPPPDTTAGDGAAASYEDSSYVPLLASELVVLNMPYWITSDNFAADVGEVLAGRGMDIPADDLRGVFAADGFHSILTLYAAWDDADQLLAITDAAVTVLQTRNQDYFPQFAAQPVTVVPLDDRRVEEVPAPMTARLLPLVRIVLGLAAGVGLAALAEYLDRTLRTRADLEALGLAVLGEIPRE